MEFTPEQIAAFQDACLVDFGEELNEKEARAMLARLVHLYARLAVPIPGRNRVTYPVPTIS